MLSHLFSQLFSRPLRRFCHLSRQRRRLDFVATEYLESRILLSNSASRDIFEMNQGESITITLNQLLENDTFASAEQFDVSDLWRGEGELVLAADGKSVTFTPDPDYFGWVGFDYSAYSTPLDPGQESLLYQDEADPNIAELHQVVAGINHIIISDYLYAGGRGRVDVYAFNGFEWSLKQTLIGTEGEYFGYSIDWVDNSGISAKSQLLVGAPGYNNSQGRVYLYEESGISSPLSQVAVVESEDPNIYDRFGESVTLLPSDYGFLVGSPGDEIDGVETGSVEYFSETGVRQYRFNAADSQAGDQFGSGLDSYVISTAELINRSVYVGAAGHQNPATAEGAV
ncbi:MAG: hypothetical protein CMN21_00765 [Rubinisphaera sp.]|nr:hypothetical protein [Rubinisphaera sp.]